jgi:hypothetical protein
MESVGSIARNCVIQLSQNSPGVIIKTVRSGDMIKGNQHFTKTALVSVQPELPTEAN